LINLVNSIRDISDSLPALSNGIPGAVVENEPDLAIFARNDQLSEARPFRRVIRPLFRNRRFFDRIAAHQHYFDSSDGYSDSDD
jgi:hypothetical protein